MDSIVMCQIKNPPAMLVPIPAVSLPMQVPANSLQKASEDGPRVWALVPMWKTLQKLLAPTFSMSPNHCNHVESKPVYKSLFSVSAFLSLCVCVCV